MAKTPDDSDDSNMRQAIAADATVILAIIRSLLAAIRALQGAHPMAAAMIAGPMREAEMHFKTMEDKILNG